MPQVLRLSAVVPPPTARLALRELADADAAFLLELLNQPGWLRHIGDRQVHDLDAARRYLREGPQASYAAHGHGLWCVTRRADGVAVGICGLIRRETLDDVDLGYAILDRHAGNGYASEAGAACLAHGREALGLERIVAIVKQDNPASQRVLDKLGLRRERGLRLPGAEHDDWLYGPG